MSRFVWNGALYGNFEPDPEPESERLPATRPIISCRYRCANCTVEWSFIPVTGPDGWNEPPLEVQHSILQHVLAEHLNFLAAGWQQNHVSPPGVYCGCIPCTASRIADRLGRLEEIRAEYLVERQAARTAPTKPAIDAPGVTILHKNKAGVYE